MQSLTEGKCWKVFFYFFILFIYIIFFVGGGSGLQMFVISALFYDPPLPEM